MIVVIGLLTVKALVVYLIPDVPKAVLSDMHKERWIAAQLKQRLEEERNDKLRATQHELETARSQSLAA